MINNVYIYIFCMAAITYLIRVLPLTLIRKRTDKALIKLCRQRYRKRYYRDKRQNYHNNCRYGQ